MGEIKEGVQFGTSEWGRQAVVGRRNYARKKPTKMQVKALQFMSQGYSPRKSMIKAGYSKNVAGAPKRTFFSTAGVQTALASMGPLLFKNGLDQYFMADKFKDWFNNPNHKVQMAAYDRWEKVMKQSTEAQEGQGRLKRKLTFEEFISDDTVVESKED